MYIYTNFMTFFYPTNHSPTPHQSISMYKIIKHDRNCRLTNRMLNRMFILKQTRHANETAFLRRPRRSWTGEKRTGVWKRHPIMSVWFDLSLLHTPMFCDWIINEFTREIAVLTVHRSLRKSGNKSRRVMYKFAFRSLFVLYIFFWLYSYVNWTHYLTNSEMLQVY